ncbi:hypothetical protein GCM10020216_021310 [Nonomuraea helvata]
MPGLRREEVALLAGISTEYCLRLEQGRDRHPSEQVLHGIARALLLDGDEETYLRELARPPRPRSRRAARPAKVSPGVESLINSWTATPAYVHGPHMVTLAANPMAVALCPHFAVGVNSLRAAFLEQEMRELYRDWDGMTAKAPPPQQRQSPPPARLDPTLQRRDGHVDGREPPPPRPPQAGLRAWAPRPRRTTTTSLSLSRHGEPMDTRNHGWFPSRPGHGGHTDHTKPCPPPFLSHGI